MTEETALTASTAAPLDVSSALHLSFTGDLALNFSISPSIDQQGVDWYLEKIGGLFSQSDIAVANLEAALVSDGWQGLQHQRMQGPAHMTQVLRALNITDVCLANNHIMDDGLHGLTQTKHHIAQAGFGAFGAGLTLEEAQAPLVKTVKGRRLAFLGACDAPYAQYGYHRRQGGTAPTDKNSLHRQIEKARQFSDAVIVSLHAGTEFVSLPEPARIAIARSLIEAGALMVVQHHPHVIQGVERYKGGLIAYSLGNFLFNLSNNAYQAHPGAREGLVLHVTLDFDNTVKISNYWVDPILIDEHNRPTLAAPPDRQRILDHFEHCSHLLGDDEAVRRHWRELCQQNVKRGLKNIYYGLRSGNVPEVIRRLRYEARSDQRRYYLGLMGMDRL